MDRERIRLLQGTPFFGGVTDAVLGLLLERVKPVEVPAGDFFFREGDPGSSAFVLERGRVSICKDWQGKSWVLRRLGQGDCFGEVALLDFGPRSASVRADEPCRAIELSARDLLEVARQNTEQFAMLYMNMGRELARRLRQADVRLFRARVEVGFDDGGYEFRSD